MHKFFEKFQTSTSILARNLNIFQKFQSIFKTGPRASFLGAYVLSKFKIKVQGAHNNTYYTTRILTQGHWKSFQGLRLGSIRIERDVSNPIPFKRFPASTYRSILTIFVQKVVGQYLAVHLEVFNMLPQRGHLRKIIHFV